MDKKMLVGVDLHTSYVWLAVRAADLAKCIGARIDLVYVEAGKSEREDGDHRRALDGLMTHLDEGVRGATLVVHGDPIAVLTERSGDYDVMVVGPREPAGWKRLVEKPMAVRVIGNARSPVFIPRTEEPRTAFPRVLLGVDLSRADYRERLAEAGRWALALGARLDAAYCEPNLALRVEEHAARETAEKHWRAKRAEQREQLHEHMKAAIEPAARGEALTPESAPGAGLVALSKDYDLVLVGTADVRTSTVFMGSVAVDVVRHAHCDVLTLPG